MQDSKGTILLAEDDLSLAYIMKDNLVDEGYEVIHCEDGQTAIDKFDKNKIDVCLLDIMMPRKDGYMVAKKIRQSSDVMPIIFLSTKGHEDDRLKGYSSGADDYICKPFSMQELLMKIQVFLRRNKMMIVDSNQEFKIGALRFSFTQLKIISKEEELKLTPKEADLLKFLCEHPNKILNRNEVLLHVWGKDDFFLGRSMDVYIAKLRKLLKADPGILLETIHGIGFRLSLPNMNEIS